MPEQELLVRIVGDDRSLQQAFTRSSRSAQQFEGRTATLGRNVSRGFAAAGVTVGLSAGLKLANDFAQAASDLNEEITKSEKIFGDSSKAIQAWSDTTANSIGVSKEQALSATGTFGNLFSTVGLGQKDAADMSKALTILGADLASFNNANIDDVLLAIRSGLIGEAEPLRRYGVLLSETRVQQEAMAATGKTNVRALTNQEKALARYNIILRDTAPAQGDFADTADGAANAQRRAAAEAADLAANIGQILTPALQGGSLAFVAMAIGINTAIDAMEDWRTQLHDTKAFDGWNQAVEDAADGAEGFFGSIRDGIPFLDDLIEKGRDAREAVRGVFDETPGDEFQQPTIVGPRGRAAAGAIRAEAEANAKAAADAIARATARANRTLDQQIADSRQRVAHLKDLIREDPANAKLQQRLTAEIKKQNDLLAQQKSLNESNARAAQAAAKAAHDASVRAAEDRRQAARDAAQAAAEARRTRIQAAQFQAIGLTAEGEQRVPGIGALRRRGRSLLNQIAGTELDTARNRDRIGAVLSKQFKDAGREVRDAILAMFNEISAALEQGSKSTQQQQTKFRVVNTSNILAGLGLSEEEQQQLRRRLSRLGPGGTTPRPGGAGGAFGFDVGSGGNTIVTGPVTVVSNDPDDFGRQLERKRRRAGLARTGNHAGTRH